MNKRLDQGRDDDLTARKKARGPSGGAGLLADDDDDEDDAEAINALRREYERGASPARVAAVALLHGASAAAPPQTAPAAAPPLGQPFRSAAREGLSPGLSTAAPTHATLNQHHAPGRSCAAASAFASFASGGQPARPHDSAAELPQPQQQEESAGLQRRRLDFSAARAGETTDEQPCALPHHAPMRAPPPLDARSLVNFTAPPARVGGRSPDGPGLQLAPTAAGVGSDGEGVGAPLSLPGSRPAQLPSTPAAVGAISGLRARGGAAAPAERAAEDSRADDMASPPQPASTLLAASAAAPADVPSGTAPPPRSSFRTPYAQQPTASRRIPSDSNGAQLPLVPGPAQIEPDAAAQRLAAMACAPPGRLHAHDELREPGPVLCSPALEMAPPPRQPPAAAHAARAGAHREALPLEQPQPQPPQQPPQPPPQLPPPPPSATQPQRLERSLALQPPPPPSHAEACRPAARAPPLAVGRADAPLAPLAPPSCGGSAARAQPLEPPPRSSLPTLKPPGAPASIQSAAQPPPPPPPPPPPLSSSEMPPSAGVASRSTQPLPPRAPPQPLAQSPARGTATLSSVAAAPVAAAAGGASAAPIEGLLPPPPALKPPAQPSHLDAVRQLPLGGPKAHGDGPAGSALLAPQQRVALMPPQPSAVRAVARPLAAPKAPASSRAQLADAQDALDRRFAALARDLSESCANFPLGELNALMRDVDIVGIAVRVGGLSKILGADSFDALRLASAAAAPELQDFGID